MEQSTSVEIDAAPERVWQVLSEVERWPEWTDTVTAVLRLDAGAFGQGSRVRVEQPKLPATEYVVSEYEAGRGFTWVASGTGVRTTAQHSIEPRPGGGCRVVLTVQQAGLLGEVMGRLLLKRLTERYLATEAAGLKARSESGS